MEAVEVLQASLESVEMQEIFDPRQCMFVGEQPSLSPPPSTGLRDTRPTPVPQEPPEVVPQRALGAALQRDHGPAHPLHGDPRGPPADRWAVAGGSKRGRLLRLPTDSLGGLDAYLLQKDPKEFHGSEVAMEWRRRLQAQVLGSPKATLV